MKRVFELARQALERYAMLEADGRRHAEEDRNAAFASG